MPYCKEGAHISHDGWEPALRTTVGLTKSCGVLPRRYKGSNKRKHGK